MNAAFEPGPPYRSIYVPFDNSALALCAADIGVEIARRSGAGITGSHVYAAALHDRRFRQMEGGLPERYLVEHKLVEQRDIHDDLITRGLRTISGCYLDAFAAKCDRAGVAFRGVALEGRNWQKLVQDIGASDHELVIMGATGLGAVSASTLGGVCERVARRIDRDLLVVKSAAAGQTGPIVAAVDGSAQAYGALRTALALGRVLERPVEAIAVYDPFFHYVAFRSLAGVLSAEAARVFRFEQQEKLHEDIIDSGLARIYRAQLEVAARIASAQGVTLQTTLLAGKAFEQILQYTHEHKSGMIALGRIGTHSDPGMDLGSTSENVLRGAGCNVLLAAGSFSPPAEFVAETSVAWTVEAQQRMERVPQFVQRMARQAVLMHAARHEHSVITSAVIDACLEGMIPGNGVHQPTAAGEKRDRRIAGECPFAHRPARANAMSGGPANRRGSPSDGEDETPCRAQ